MENMVVIASFPYIEMIRAEILVSLLKSNGIDCFIRNELANQVLAGAVGDVSVEILEGDMPRALKVMKENNFEEKNK